MTSTLRLLKQATAWLPLLMSLAAFGLILGYVALFGISGVPAQDEGTAAYLFQLLMVLQLPVIGWFALRELPRAPKQASLVLGLQAALWLCAIGLIWWLEH